MLPVTSPAGWTPPTDAARAAELTVAWVRRRVRRLGPTLAAAAVVALVGGYVAVATSGWRDDLLRTGLRTTGTVIGAESYSTKGGPRERVTVQVTRPIARRFTVRTPAGVYEPGEVVFVWLDPGNPDHARTEGYTTDADTSTTVAAVLALIAGAGVLVAAGALWFARTTGQVAEDAFRDARLCTMVRRRIGRSHRMIVQFDDTGDTAWSTSVHEKRMRLGRAFVAGHGRYRVVVFPDAKRPYLLRPARTAFGRASWRRALDGRDARRLPRLVRPGG